MSHSMMKIFLFFYLAILYASADSRDAAQRLQLGSYSEEEVKGCYYFNQTLGVCFDILKDSMKLLKTTGEPIVIYEEIGPDMFFFQVLDQGFIGHGSAMIYVPKEVPRVPVELRAFLAFQQERSTEQRQLLKNHYQEAKSELHYTPEVKLLERLSQALGEKSPQYEILGPFHTLCLNLLKASDTEAPAEFKAVLGLEDEATDEQGGRQKRCRSLQSDPGNNNCLGMCGKSCSCWRWVCGDCCWHYGCYQHDICCGRDFYSSYCLTPWRYNFSCSSYGGYAKC